MNYNDLTAPCGIPCFECVSFKATSNPNIQAELSKRTGISLEDAKCNGCRENHGKCFLFKKNNILPQGDCMLFADDEGHCKIYNCTQKKGIHNCSECSKFPCENLHPIADKANVAPQNLKVYNLCMIKKNGVERWAKNHANGSWNIYFNQKFGS
ncbi:DUF3795 domain-containing protein [Marispirochaeta sp.]|jgi:hypothetical protein|uniref:DUF3795 domain-containing protein n=1 Tax=Marispirochaeta sp. TaxID=2038653 RepID=UPI0029C7BABE|nr:DUF3795 domain-containing protein [Marispirochaeta sp.]